MYFQNRLFISYFSKNRQSCFCITINVFKTLLTDVEIKILLYMHYDTNYVENEARIKICFKIITIN